MSTHVLVKYNKDRADEFNCKGFGVFEKSAWEKYKREKYKKAVKKGF